MYNEHQSFKQIFELIANMTFKSLKNLKDDVTQNNSHNNNLQFCVFEF